MPKQSLLTGFELTDVDRCFSYLVHTVQDENVSWAVLKPDIFAAITDYLSSGEPLIHDEDTLAASDTAIHPDDSEVRRMKVKIKGMKGKGRRGQRKAGAHYHAEDTLAASETAIHPIIAR